MNRIVNQFALFFIVLIFNSFSCQVGIGTDNPSAGSLLDLSGNGAFVLPRIFIADQFQSLDPITSDLDGPHDPVFGMQIYNTNPDYQSADGNGTGIYMWTNNGWTRMLNANDNLISGGNASPLWNISGTSTKASSLTDNLYHQGSITIGTETADNIDKDMVSLNLMANDKGVLINKVELSSLTSTEPLVVPNDPTALEDGILVYNEAATGISHGFYYWYDNKWYQLFSNDTSKAMNQIYTDTDTYTVANSVPFVAPKVTDPMVLFECEYDYNESGYNEGLANIPIPNFQIFRNDDGDAQNMDETIYFPQQSLGTCVSISISFKFDASTVGNTDGARIIFYSKNPTTGLYDELVKEYSLKLTKTGSIDYHRDELVIQNLIVTQTMVDNGIRVYVGSTNLTPHDFYEPTLSMNFGILQP